MPKNTKKIPPGYMLSIESWENDADDYMTQVFYGLTKPDTEMLIGIAKLFKSMGNRTDPGYGGGSWHWKNGEKNYFPDVYKAIEDEILKHPDASKDLRDHWTIDRTQEDWEDEYYETISEVVGYPVAEMYQTDGYIRVFSSFTVHYQPKEVADVTNEFK